MKRILNNPYVNFTLHFILPTLLFFLVGYATLASIGFDSILNYGYGGE